MTRYFMRIGEGSFWPCHDCKDRFEAADFVRDFVNQFDAPLQGKIISQSYNVARPTKRTPFIMSTCTIFSKNKDGEVEFIDTHSNQPMPESL